MLKSRACWSISLSCSNACEEAVPLHSSTALQHDRAVVAASLDSERLLPPVNIVVLHLELAAGGCNDAAAATHYV